MPKNKSISMHCSDRLKQFFRRLLFGNGWFHIAIVRTEGILKTFKDGKSWEFNGEGDLLTICEEDYGIDEENFTINFWITIINRIRDWSYIAKRNLMNYIY